MKTGILLAAAMAAAVLAAALPAGSAERYSPAGVVTYTPEPATEQYGTFDLPREMSAISSLRFKVEEGTTEIRSFRVRYRDGDSERFTIRDTFEAGDRTEAFELDPEHRVRSVEIAFTPRGKVKIALLVDGGGEPEPPPPPPPPALTWTEFGCNDVSFLNDTDRVDVAPPRRMKAVRLRAFTFDIQVTSLRVRYSDGSSERLTLNTIVPANARTNAIELSPGGRKVQQIELSYGSTGFGTRPGQMCVDGQVLGP